ncbi:hypothetical protein D3C79_1071570 [compost metagenome]
MLAGAFHTPLVLSICAYIPTIAAETGNNIGRLVNVVLANKYCALFSTIKSESLEAPGMPSILICSSMDGSSAGR